MMQHSKGHCLICHSTWDASRGGHACASSAMPTECGRYCGTFAPKEELKGASLDLFNTPCSEGGIKHYGGCKHDIDDADFKTRCDACKKSNCPYLPDCHPEGIEYHNSFYCHGDCERETTLNLIRMNPHVNAIIDDHMPDFSINDDVGPECYVEGMYTCYEHGKKEIKEGILWELDRLVSNCDTLEVAGVVKAVHAINKLYGKEKLQEKEDETSHRPGDVS